MFEIQFKLHNFHPVTHLYTQECRHLGLDVDSSPSLHLDLGMSTSMNLGLGLSLNMSLVLSLNLGSLFEFEYES